ncbi:MAG: GNAT family N-acetyltransferase [Pseudomonadota bacterium]
MQYDGFRPGAAGAIVALHGRHYAANWGFGPGFEGKVAEELGAFLRQHDPARDLFRAAYDGDTLVGSLIIDHTVTGEGGAHLRWFIVSEAARGTGVGRQLMADAMAFVDDQRTPLTWLTTFSGLTAARALYERFGFTLTREDAIDQWNGGVREQRFERRLP